MNRKTKDALLFGLAGIGSLGGMAIAAKYAFGEKPPPACPAGQHRDPVSNLCVPDVPTGTGTVTLSDSTLDAGQIIGVTIGNFQAAETVAFAIKNTVTGAQRGAGSVIANASGAATGNLPTTGLAAGSYQLLASGTTSFRTGSASFTISDIVNPPPTGGRSGLYIPLYSSAMSTAAAGANQTLTGFPNLFTANPSSGPVPPGNRIDIVNNLSALKSGNPSCKVLGYIATGWTGVPISSITSQLDMWADWNDFGRGKIIDGIMWDEYEGTSAAKTYYRQITNLARDRGLSFIRGNPGTELQDRTHLDGTNPILDVVSVHESSFLHSEADMRRITFNGAYPKHRFNYLAHSIPLSGNPTGPISLNQFTDTWFRMAINYVGTIYITDDRYNFERCRDQRIDCNPWDVVSTYLNRQVSMLQAQPA